MLYPAAQLPYVCLSRLIILVPITWHHHLDRSHTPVPHAVSERVDPKEVILQASAQQPTQAWQRCYVRLQEMVTGLRYHKAELHVVMHAIIDGCQHKGVMI